MLKYPFYISRKLGYSESGGGTSSVLRFAMVGIALAVAVMVISLAVLSGFRKEITHRIYSLDNHVKVSVPEHYDTHETIPINFFTIDSILAGCHGISSVVPVVEKYAIFKTYDNFQGIKLRGIDSSYNTNMIRESLIKGDIPAFSDSTLYDILISSAISAALGIDVDDNIFAYFIDDKVRVRKLTVSGIFDTNFEDFDNSVALCNIDMLRALNGWDNNQSSYVGADFNDTSDLQDKAYSVYSLIYDYVITHSSTKNYIVENLYDTNISYFAWLDLLDSNIAVILILMAFVSGFTIIAALLVIILDHVRTIGVLNTLGVTAGSMKLIFILLAQGVVVKALIAGNIIGLLVCAAQYYWHIVALDSTSYYMSYVPVNVEFWHILLLNVGVVVFAFATLVLPSMLIAKITPAASLRYE